MPTLKATREVRYAGATRLPGQEFEASDKDAKLLVAIKKAVLVTKPVAYQAAAVKAEEPAPVPLDEAPRSRRGRYRTTALKAEE